MNNEISSTRLPCLELSAWSRNYSQPTFGCICVCVCWISIFTDHCVTKRLEALLMADHCLTSWQKNRWKERHIAQRAAIILYMFEMFSIISTFLGRNYLPLALSLK